MEHREPLALFSGSCPNCGGDLSDAELLGPGLCRLCLPQPTEELLGLKREERASKFIELLAKSDRQGSYLLVLKQELQLREFEEFFRELVGHAPWELQRSWAKRLLLGRSFSIVAPTGYGKTTFGLVSALYLALRGIKGYIMVPTALLVQHLGEKCKALSAKLERQVRTVAYHSGLPRRSAQEALGRISTGDFDVLITTDRFIYSRYELLSSHDLGFIFVDDVESFLSSPRNIDKVLHLLGFGDEDLSKAFEAIRRGQLYPSAPISPKAQRLLVLAGSTLRQGGLRLKLFRYLMGFEPASPPDLVRNVANFYLEHHDIERKVQELLKEHGPGCLVLTPVALGRDYALSLAEALRREGIRARAYVRPEHGLLAAFQEGKLEALVGLAGIRSPVAKGLDLPEVIRYAIFAGVPRRQFSLSLEGSLSNPRPLLRLLRALLPVLPSEDKDPKLLRALGQRAGRAAASEELIRRAWELVYSAAKERGLPPDLGLRLEAMDGDSVRVVAPDIAGYVQGSGRTSRLSPLGVTRGISIVLVDDPLAFTGLARRLKLLLDEEFLPLNEERLKKEFERVDEDRRLLRDVKYGGGPLPRALPEFRSTLIVVESPTKAKTIASFFGRPVRRQLRGLLAYEVASQGRVLSITSCQGHIFDLTTKAGLHGVLRLDGSFLPVYTDIRRCRNCGEQFTDLSSCPACGSSDWFSKREIVEALRLLSLEVGEVLIATDPDAEGEKIAFDLACQLKPYNDRLSRIEFREVTRTGFLEALNRPRDIDLLRVQAQLLRRIEDRWIGFGLSERLWKKFGQHMLSAGRVQTPVLGWIVRRTEEARRKARYLRVRLENGLEVLYTLADEGALKGTLEGRLARVACEPPREELIAPPPPFSTDALLREASRLRVDVERAMQLAQDLFEAGLITYHRTDAIRVSDVGLKLAADYLAQRGLPFVARKFGEEGAHECIRPTKPLDAGQLRFYVEAQVLALPITLTSQHWRLYDLIFRRFMASQSAPARALYQQVAVLLDGLEAKRKVLVKVLEPGFLELLPLSQSAEGPYEPGHYKVAKAVSWWGSAAKPYTQADVLALMKERGLGRPSTYARILGTLLKRGYVIRRDGVLFGTGLGKRVYLYLANEYGGLVSEETTRHLEEAMDAVEQGRVDYRDVIASLYEDLGLLLK